MAPATEICFLPLKEESYPDDATSAAGQKFKGVLDTILSQHGSQRLYWGRQVEHPSILTLFIDWDSVEHHEKFIASDTYKPFSDEVGTLLSGPARLYHVNFIPHPPTQALYDGTPFATEFITFYFPTDYSAEEQQDVEKRVQDLTAAIAESSDGFKKSAGGWVAEELDLPDGSGKAKGFVALLGWKSVEAHLKFRDTQAFKDNIHLLREAKRLKQLAVFHVSVKEVQKA